MDIIDDLRGYAVRWGPLSDARLAQSAADEIERLRKKVLRVRAEALRLCESANAIGADGRGIDAYRLAQRDELRDYARAILDLVGASDVTE